MTISNETWAAIIGALAGSASGGAITAGLQWLSMGSHDDFTRHRSVRLPMGKVVSQAEEGLDRQVWSFRPIRREPQRLADGRQFVAGPLPLDPVSDRLIADVVEIGFERESGHGHCGDHLQEQTVVVATSEALPHPVD
jgi:hypothetical protein